LLNTIDCAALLVPTLWEAKVRLVGEYVRVGVPCTPFPLSETGGGAVPPFVFIKMLNVPFLSPAAVGTKLACTVQLCPAGIPGPHAFVCEKSPVRLKFVKRKQLWPVLFRVMGCEALEVPTLVSGNERAVGETLIAAGKAECD